MATPSNRRTSFSKPVSGATTGKQAGRNGRQDSREVTAWKRKKVESGLTARVKSAGGEGVRKHARTRQRSVLARGKNGGKNNCNAEVRLGQSSRYER